MAPEEIRAALEALGAERALLADHARRGVHVDVLVPAARLREAAQALRDRGFLLEDVTAVDAAPELLAVYHLNHTGPACRVALRVLADRGAPEVPSIRDIYPGADWHERETHDFYGLVFAGHPDLSPLILPEDAGDLRPLRKDEKGLKSLGEVIPEFAPAAPDGEPGPAGAADEADP